MFRRKFCGHFTNPAGKCASPGHRASGILHPGHPMTKAIYCDMYRNLPSDAPNYIQKDTKALVCDFKMPEVDSKVICRQVGFLITVDGYGIDMIGMSISKYSTRTSFYHQLHWLKHWNTQRCDG